VREKHDINSFTYDFDLNDHVIVLNDWATELLVPDKYERHLYSHGDDFATSILIGGRGINISDSTNKHQVPRSVYKVKHGYKYRFRVVNVGAYFCPMEFSIEDHDLLMIATDGNSIEPVKIKSFVVFGGERVDVVVNANKNSINNYWIKVKGYADCGDNEIYQTAVLEYDSSNGLPQTSIDYQKSGPDPNNPVILVINLLKNITN